MFEHLSTTFSLGHFQAHEERRPTAFQITEGMEYLELITNGQVWYEDEDGTRQLYGRGTLFWHLPGEWTVCDFPRGQAYGCYVVKFYSSTPQRPSGHVTCPEDREGIFSFVERMFQAFHNASPVNPMAVYSMYATLAYHALGPQRIRQPEHPRPLLAVLAYLEKHSNQEVDLRTLAATGGVSEDYLFALFRKHLGTTPHQHLLALRIGQAKQMLAGTDRSIKQVAADCGFNSTEVFYRQFLRHVEITPARYRRLYQPIVK